MDNQAENSPELLKQQLAQSAEDLKAALQDRDKLEASYKELSKQLVSYGSDFKQVYTDLKVHEELARVSELKDNLVKMIVHDIKNPLSSMDLTLQVMGDPPDPTILDGPSWDILRKQTSYALEMCEQLLDITKIESDQLELSLGQKSIRDTVAAAVMPFQLQAANKRIAINTEVADVVLDTDHSLLKRVLLNLLNNALKYSPADDTIAVEGKDAGGTITLAVSDNGPGIPEAYQQKIFELFGSAEIRTEVRGVGIGLAFCRMAMEAMGGTIVVESGAGRGSKFIVQVPMELPKTDSSLK